ncbi:hypothetical protein GCM10023340_10930 [Nocardioides marinquilinus]|uniref:Uncharacterized protein n=1 Tax=Nocardioides marinquilinus TaxID=1210400 RepID=A0ABP9PBP7_9ACTN
MLRQSEKFEVKGRTLTVSSTDVEVMPRVRTFLIGVARSGGTATYGELKVGARLTHATNGLGRLLDLVGVDCRRRGEPDLAALVVTKQTGEVGDEYGAGAARERSIVHRHRWSD